MVKPKQRKDGTWRAPIYLGKDVYGKKIYKDIYGKTEKECSNKMIEYLYKLKNGTAEEAKINKKLKTFEDYYDKWLNDRDDILDNTKDEYKSVKKCHLQKLIKLDISKIDNTLIKQYYRDLKKEKGDDIVRRVSMRLNFFLKSMSLEENCPIKRNILDNIQVPKKKKIKHCIVERKQYKHILEQLKKEFYDENSNIGYLYPMILLTGGAGMRISESLVVDMDEIELNKDIIPVNRQQTNIKGKGYVIVDRTKTESGERKTCILQSIKQELINIIIYKKYQLAKAKLLDKDFAEKTKKSYIKQDGTEIQYICSNFLVTNNNFKMVPRNTAERNWKEFRENLGYTKVRIHDMRRFFANLLLLAKVPDNVQTTIMGHAIKEDTEYYQDVTDEVINVYTKDIII